MYLSRLILIIKFLLTKYLKISHLKLTLYLYRYILISRDCFGDDYISPLHKYSLNKRFNMRINNKVFVVTGAGSGMGREIALNLISKGARVAAIDINQENLEKTQKLANQGANRFACFTLDITNKELVDELPSKIIKHFGEVDAIINNAGIIQPFIKIEDLNFNDIDKVLNVNLYGTLYMTKAFLPYLLKRPEAYIANVSSMGALVPVPGQVLYGASKAAVKLLTEGLMSELSNTNINVSIIIPGAVMTNITANSGLPGMNDSDQANSKNKVLPAPEAAEIIIRGIEKNKPRILVGKDAKIVDWFSRIAPLRAAKTINKHMAALLKG